MFSRRVLTIAALVLLSSVAGVSASEPPWVMLERGKVAFERRDLASALDILSDTVESQEEYPEAEFWLGRVYESQGQLVLAEEQYRRALNLSVYLRVPDDKILYEYALASLLMDKDSEGSLEAEALLLGIINREGGASPENISLGHKYIETLTEGSIDELLFLFREESTYSLKARRILGEKAWETGHYRSSLLHSTRVVLSLLSTAAENYRELRSDWRFDINLPEDRKQPDRDVRYPGYSDGTVDLIEGIYAYIPETADWLEQEAFWAQLYLMASSLFAEGYAESAVSIWSLMVLDDPLDGSMRSRSESGLWGRLSLRQLDEPFISKGSITP